MKIAYIGYDILYPCLEALDAAGCTVMEVFTCNTDNIYEFNHKVKAFAKTRGLPCHTERITLDDIHRLRDNGCEAIFSAGYFYRVPIDHSLPIVNVHPAMLPIGRGAWPMPTVILRGMHESGVTLHKMESDFDSGDILIQESFPVTDKDDLETMTDTICEIGARLCTEVVSRFRYYYDNAIPQGEHEYWDCPTKEDATITADTSPADAERILRAFLGFDCYLRISEDREICIVRGRFSPIEHAMEFGTKWDSGSGEHGFAVNGGVILIP